MSSPSSPPLILDVRARSAERALAWGILGLAFVCPWLFAGPPLVLAALSVLCVGVSWLGLFHCGWLEGARRVAQVAWLADGRWFITTSDGRSMECELDLTSRVGAMAIWLRLRTCELPVRRYSLLLTRADDCAEDVRRLGIRLRLEGTRSPGRPDLLPAAH